MSQLSRLTRSLKQKYLALKEKVKGWRTLLWNAFVVGVAPVLLFATDWLSTNYDRFQLSPGKVLGFIVLVKGVDSWLRFVTVGPVGSKGDEEPAPEVKAGD